MGRAPRSSEPPLAGAWGQAPAPRRREDPAQRAAGGRRPEASANARVRAAVQREGGPPAAAGAAGVGADPGSAAPAVPGAAGPRGGSDWAGLPEDLLVNVAGKLVAQNEAGWAARLREEAYWPEERIQREMAKRKRDGNCLFVFARVCKGWRKAQLEVGGRLCSRVESHVLLPGQVGLAKWALAEGCPRENRYGYCNPRRPAHRCTMAQAAAFHGQIELVKWLCGEAGFAMNETVMNSATCSGNLKLVQWLRGNGCPWNAGICHFAVDKGDVEVLRWARENGCPWCVEDRDRAAAELGYTDDLGNLVDMDGNLAL